MTQASRDRVRARLLALAGTDSDPSRHDSQELVRNVDRLVESDQPLASPDQLGSQSKLVLAELDGLGLLVDLVNDSSITDIFVNGDGRVWFERAGVLQQSPISLGTDDVYRTIERIVLPLGLRADRSSPTVDARLSDGTRVHVILPPLVRTGPVITFRRFAGDPLPFSAFGESKVVDLLAQLVAQRRSVLVCGSTGSGKTTLVRALCSQVPANQRIIVVEDLAELAIRHAHVVELEARPPNSDGKGQVTMRELLRNALRMRPDRLVVGEVRGGEAFDLLQALHTGHNGSLSTLHARSCRDALDRFEALVLLAGSGIATDAIRRQISAAVDVVVRVARTSTGARHVVEVVEVVPCESSAIGRKLVDLLHPAPTPLPGHLAPFRARTVA
jgi:pilus assembly protein CpaF